MYVLNNPINDIDLEGLESCYKYKILSIESVEINILKHKGKCPPKWLIEKAISWGKDRFVGEEIVKECKKGICKNKKEVHGQRTLSGSVTQTFWWKLFDFTLDPDEGRKKMKKVYYDRQHSWHSIS